MPFSAAWPRGQQREGPGQGDLFIFSLVRVSRGRQADALEADGGARAHSSRGPRSRSPGRRPRRRRQTPQAADTGARARASR